MQSEPNSFTEKINYPFQQLNPIFAKESFEMPIMVVTLPNMILFLIFLVLVLIGMNCVLLTKLQRLTLSSQISE
jgi:hypothetical protein